MARQVLLSFDGAAEIPFTPYQATQDREAEVPAVPGIPAIPGTPAVPGPSGFPGIPAGGVAQWRLESNANVPGTNRVPNHSGSIEIGQMSFYLVGVISAGFRWYSVASNTEWFNFADGFSYVEISTIDTFGTNREEELLAIPPGIPFYIYHLQVSPHGLVFRWEVTPTQVIAVPYTGGGTADATFVHYPVHGQLQVYNGADWDNISLAINATYNGIGVFRDTTGQSISIDPQSQWKPGVWGVSGIGGGGTGTPEIINYTDIYDTHATSQVDSVGEWASSPYGSVSLAATKDPVLFNLNGFFILFGDITIPDDPTSEVRIFGDGIDRNYFPTEINPEVGDQNLTPPAPWSIQGIFTLAPSTTHEGATRLDIESELIITTTPYNQAYSQLPARSAWGDRIDVTIIRPLPDIPPSPAVPPFGGTPGTPAGPDTPAVPGIPGIPAVPAIYEGAMYGRPAIPPFGIWAERLAMTMTHRVENELEIIDIQISGHDYIIRQDWVAPKDYRVRPFCWMQDERGIVQTVETVDQSDEMTTRFSTMAIVNGPANATAPPLPADFQEGDDIVEPSFRVQPEVVNHVFVVHDPAEARLNQPISPVRVGWSQTRNHDAEILTRVNNHPLDGALLTTTDMVFNTPPFPPGISGDLTLYLHIWVEGSTDLMAILINEANEIAKFTRIGTLRVNTIQGILFVSIARFPPETSDSSFEVSTNDPTDVIVTPPGGDVPTEAQVRAIVDQRLEDQLLTLTIRPATATGVAGQPPTLYYSRTGLFICPIFLELLPKVSFTIPQGRRIVDIFDSGATVTQYFTVDPNNARRWISNFEYGPNAGLELVINTEAS